MKNKVILGLVVLAAIIAFISWRSEPSVTPRGGESLTYASSTLGFSFTYPDTYFLEERDTGSALRARHTIVLMEDTKENRELGQPGQPPREGPPTITFDFFQNNLDQTSVERWIYSSNFSNYKQSPDGLLSNTTVTVDNVPAYYYRWSGLYEGESVVFEHNQNIVMASVTHLTPTDQIRKDFARILLTMQLATSSQP